MPKILNQRGDKFLIKDDKGTIREVKRDREGIKRGDYLQPNVPQEKDRYIQTYGRYPQEDPADVKRYLKRRGLLNKFNPEKY